MRRWCVAALLVVGCGRISFDPVGASMDGDAPPGDGLVAGDALTGDASSVGCADNDIGSTLGPNVASGTTTGQGDDYSGCSGDASDLTFGWVAPATATFRIDLCASPSGFDSVLSVLNGSCTGTELACDDDSCGGIGPSRLTVDLVAGQAVVIVVDGDFSGDTGTYQLAIMQL